MSRRLLCVDGRPRPGTGTDDRRWHPTEGEIYMESCRGVNPFTGRKCVTVMEDPMIWGDDRITAPDGRSWMAADRFVDITDWSLSESESVHVSEPDYANHP